jgi:hypothetical protein
VKTSVSPSDIFSWGPGVITEQVEKTSYFYVLDTNSGQMFQVDQIAADFCARINGKHKVSEISRVIAKRRKMDGKSLLSLAQPFLAELVKKKLLVKV